jgi:multimeric flavodoxin WrbA
MKKILILNGSPRKNGSTAFLAQEAARAFHDQGIETETIFLNEVSIKGCQSCFWCKKNNVAECAIKDDMQELHRKIKECDGMIVASPIYFGSVTAQTKLWLDRMYPYLNMDLTSKLPPGKKISFIFTQGNPDASRFRPVTDIFVWSLEVTGFEVKDQMVGCALDADQIKERKDLMEQAYRIGKNLLA